MNKALWLFGTELTILTDAAATNGYYDLAVCAWPAGLETPLHTHTRYAAAVYLLKGELTIHTSGNARVLHAGEYANTPPDTPYAIAVTSQTTSKRLTITSPSGLTQLIEKVGVEGKNAGVRPDAPPDMALFQRASAEVGDVPLGPLGSRP